MPSDDPIDIALQDLRSDHYPRRALALARLQAIPTSGIHAEVRQAAHRALRHDDHEIVRAFAAKYLGQFPHPDDLSVLKPALYDRHLSVRLEVIQVLRHHDDAAARQLLESVRDDPDPHVRNQVAIALPKRMGPPVDPMPTVTGNLDGPGVISTLCRDLEDPDTTPRQLLQLAETLAERAARLPSPELRPACEALRKRILFEASPRRLLILLKAAETSLGATLPVPASGGSIDPTALPRPVSPHVSGTSPNSPTVALYPTSSAEFTVPHIDQKVRQAHIVIFVLAVIGISLTLYDVSSGNIPKYTKLTEWLFTASSGYFYLKAFVDTPTNISREAVSCRGRQLALRRCIGPFRWRRTVLLPTGSRVYVVRQRFRSLRILLGHGGVHLACLGSDGRPLRFAYARSIADLERLAAKINTYLEQQEAVAPAPSRLEPEPQRNPEPTIPAQINRHVP